MQTMTPTIDTGLLSRLPAGPILMRVRRLIVTTGIAAFAYTVLSTGSAAYGNGCMSFFRLLKEVWKKEVACT